MLFEAAQMHHQSRVELLKKHSNKITFKSIYVVCQGHYDKLKNENLALEFQPKMVSLSHNQLCYTLNFVLSLQCNTRK